MGKEDKSFFFFFDVQYDKHVSGHFIFKARGWSTGEESRGNGEIDLSGFLEFHHWLVVSSTAVAVDREYVVIRHKLTLYPIRNYRVKPGFSVLPRFLLSLRHPGGRAVAINYRLSWYCQFVTLDESENRVHRCPGTVYSRLLTIHASVDVVTSKMTNKTKLMAQKLATMLQRNCWQLSRLSNNCFLVSRSVIILHIDKYSFNIHQFVFVSVITTF